VFLLRLIVICLAMSACPVAAATGPGRPVRIVVLQLEGVVRSEVSFNTPGQFARVFIPLFGVGQVMANTQRRHDLGARLDATLGRYDREAVLFDAVVASFGQRSPMFEFARGEFDYADFRDTTMDEEAFPQGHDYVLVLNEVFSGLAMSNAYASRDGLVAPTAVLEAVLYDGRNRKELAYRRFSANGLEGRPLEDALQDRAFFVDTYPAIARTLASQLVGHLNREDVLHAMAASVGRGAEVPPIEQLLARHARRFRFDTDPLPGWKRTKMDTKYAVVIEPKDARRTQFGIRLEADLLVPEFGQQVGTIDQYLDKVRDRLATQGVDPETLAPFDDLTMPPGYRVVSYVTDPARDGRIVLAVRQRDTQLVELMHVIFSRDFATGFPIHRAEIERNLARTRMELRD
jgi:hypothetical protein